MLGILVRCCGNNINNHAHASGPNKRTTWLHHSRLCMPPATTSVSPVIYAASSELRNATAPAISCGVPKRLRLVASTCMRSCSSTTHPRRTRHRSAHFSGCQHANCSTAPNRTWHKSAHLSGWQTASCNVHEQGCCHTVCQQQCKTGLLC